MIDETTGGLRDTYSVLEDLAKVYPDLNTQAKAYLNEVIAGNRQNKVLVAIMDNWENVADATETAKILLVVPQKKMLLIWIVLKVRLHN